MQLLAMMTPVSAFNFATFHIQAIKCKGLAVCSFQVVLSTSVSKNTRAWWTILALRLGNACTFYTAQ